MKNTSISYPHPVLGNADDFPGVQIDLDFKYEFSDESITIKTTKQLITGHTYFDDLIKEGTAQWLIRIKCARTYMREIYLSTAEDWEEVLSGQDYEGLVKIETEVIAAKYIENYKPSGLHEDYDGADFSIQAGGILAIGPILSFNVEKHYDSLKAPLESIVKVVLGTHLSGPFETILDDDFIIVKLSKQDWAQYGRIRNRVPTILHSAIALPVLAIAISKIREHEACLWSGRLNSAIAQMGLSSENPLKVAQELLDNPLTRAFKELNTRLDKGTS
jgi:hypothetical protein